MMWLIILCVVAVCAAIIAGQKNRNQAGWFVLTLLLAPAILILLCLPKLEDDSNTQTTPIASPVKATRECPYCAEEILAKAKVCKHCGRDVEPLAVAVAENKQVENQ